MAQKDIPKRIQMELVKIDLKKHNLFKGYETFTYAKKVLMPPLYENPLVRKKNFEILHTNI